MPDGCPTFHQLSLPRHMLQPKSSLTDQNNYKEIPLLLSDALQARFETGTVNLLDINAAPSIGGWCLPLVLDYHHLCGRSAQRRTK